MSTIQSTSQIHVSRPDSTLQTPALSPSNSAGPSPALSVLQSPAVSELDLENPFDNIGYQDDEDIMPECWGHRGASASFPENTIASFVEACKTGADGIETDIHVTTDNVLVMFHDPELHRTTDGEGRIDKLPWKGVLEHVRTLEKPHQPIPQFTQVIDLLLQPENSRVKINLDLKVENDPVRLFGLIKSVVESYEGWQKKLAPRIVLGIWHPKFIVPATTILPYLPRYAISMDISQCRKYFFNICHGFSIRYEALATSEGARFRQECKAAGKKICSWTVNDPEEMRQCARWGIASVISDKPDLWRKIRLDIETDRAKALKPTLQSYISPFFQKKNWWFDYQRLAKEETEYLEREAGTFDIPVPHVEMHIATPGY
ncbi:glycerophosphodiesterase [Cryptococcus neoformans]|nr:glycerophosphodiesterase [Cryptococcus neoformans var. grubii Bt1]OXH31054.1 glycerophosphodiesterase [Cryptococcus neoformans var. grubii]